MTTRETCLHSLLFARRLRGDSVTNQPWSRSADLPYTYVYAPNKWPPLFILLNNVFGTDKLISTLCSRVVPMTPQQYALANGDMGRRRFVAGGMFLRGYYLHITNNFPCTSSAWNALIASNEKEACPRRDAVSFAQRPTECCCYSTELLPGLRCLPVPSIGKTQVCISSSNRPEYI